MYPLLRLVTTSIDAAISGPLQADAVGETTFRCMPWDLDMFLEMNNGRILTLYDLGRFNLSFRIGLIKILRQKHWGLVVAGSTVRYRKRIRVFDKVTMRTQVTGFDERWVYITQSMRVKGQATSSVLLRTAITSKGKIISTNELLDALHINNWKPEPSNWIKSWIASEENRPWPPSP